MATFAVPLLGLPAMFVAGLASSTHCALMCGLLQARASGAAAWSRQLGRLVAYAGLGAIAGGAGQWLLRLQDGLIAGSTLRVAALLLMAVLLLRRATQPTAPACCVAQASGGRGAWRGVIEGLLWGVVPCALLYAAASYALLAGSATRGALLMFAFGLGTMPALGLGGWIWRRVGARAAIAPTRAWRAASLVLVGASVLALGAPHALPWCRP